MSQMTATARATTVRAPRRSEPSRPALRVVVAAPRPARRLPFALLCSFIAAAGLLSLLLLNMGLAQGAYQLHDLQAQSTVLAEQEEKAREALAAQEAPAQLAERAQQLGMVPGSSPAFLRLPDGQILGVPQKAAEAPTPEAKGADAAPAPGARSGTAARSTRPTSSASATATPAPRPGSTQTGRAQSSPDASTARGTTPPTTR